MKANQLATLVLRLMGIYCLVLLFPMAQLLNSAIFYAQSSSGGFGVSLVVVIFLLLACWLTVGISLIIFSRPLGEMLTPKGSEESDIKAISFEQAQALAFAVAGVLIFAEALPQLLGNFVIILSYLAQHPNENGVPAFDRPLNRYGVLTAVGSFFKATLGLYLFFRAQGFASFWRSLRTFGTPRAPEVEQHETNQ